MSERFTNAVLARLSEAAAEPAWLADARISALARFEALPWPSGDEEEWRHTDLRTFDLDSFDPERRGSAEVTAGVDVLARVAGELEDLADVIGSAGVSAHEEKLGALNAAFGSVRFIRVPRGVQIEEPIEVTHRVEPGGTWFPRTIILAEEGSSITYIDRYGSGGPASTHPALCLASVEIFAAAASNVNYLAVQDWPQSMWHFNVQRARIERDATVRSLAASLGAKVSRSLVESLLDGQGASSELLGVYFGDSDQHIDNRSLQNHRAPNTTSDLYYKGALKGSSRAVYSGLVKIEKDARGSDAQQANRNLLLSDGAAADPKPFLEIENNEVRCTHGVSVGQPDAETLFYLRSRGLSDADAERLFVKGFFQEVLDRVRVPSIREALEAAVEDELELD